MGFVGEVKVTVSPEPVSLISLPVRRPVTRLVELALEPENVAKRSSILVDGVCAWAANESPMATASRVRFMMLLSCAREALLGLQDDLGGGGAVEEDRAVARDHAHARGAGADRLEGDLDLAVVADGLEDLGAVLALLGARD